MGQGNGLSPQPSPAGYRSPGAVGLPDFPGSSAVGANEVFPATVHAAMMWDELLSLSGAELVGGTGIRTQSIRPMHMRTV